MESKRKSRSLIKTSSVTTLTDKHNKGKLLETSLTTYKSYKTESEPNFVKCYTDLLFMLETLTHKERAILDYLMGKILFNNTIKFDTTSRDKAVKALKISRGFLNNTINKMTKVGVLKSLSRAKYFMNPYLYAKGTWNDIKQMRDNFTDCESKGYKRKDKVINLNDKF